MDKKKKNYIITGILILIAIIFTILVTVVDVQSIGPKGSEVGFATINKFVLELFGRNDIFYNITEWLGIIPIIMVMIYAFIGCMQLVKRKNLFKVDKEIIALGVFYVVVAGLYVFFEKVIINYRPVLIEGILEASYPSSHTLMSICFCGSALMLNKKYFKEKHCKILNIFLIVTMILIVIGRLISGVHWFTDIVGGCLISAAVLMILNCFINNIEKTKEKAKRKVKKN